VIHVASRTTFACLGWKDLISEGSFIVNLVGHHYSLLVLERSFVPRSETRRTAVIFTQRRERVVSSRCAVRSKTPKRSKKNQLCTYVAKATLRASTLIDLFVCLFVCFVSNAAGIFTTRCLLTRTHAHTLRKFCLSLRQSFANCVCCFVLLSK
jgi:hypothetical protein